jgi:hypothetical protein
MVLDVIFSLGLSYGLFKYMTHDIGNSTGDMGAGIASLAFTAITFVILIVVVGFILYSLIL